MELGCCAGKPKSCARDEIFRAGEVEPISTVNSVCRIKSRILDSRSHPSASPFFIYAVNLLSPSKVDKNWKTVAKAEPNGAFSRNIENEIFVYKEPLRNAFIKCKAKKQFKYFL